MSEVHSKEWYENYAVEHGFELGKVADKIIEKLKETDAMCPCKVALWKKLHPNELDKIICPCSEHLEEIEKDGHCHCMLFVKPKNKQ